MTRSPPERAPDSPAMRAPSDRPESDLVLVFTEDATRASATVHRIATFALHDDEWHLRADVHPPLPELTLARLNTETWPELHDLWGWARKMLGELNAAPRGVPHPYLVVTHSAAWLQHEGRGFEPLCECKADPRCSSVSGANEGIDQDTADPDSRGQEETGK